MNTDRKNLVKGLEIVNAVARVGLGGPAGALSVAMETGGRLILKHTGRAAEHRFERLLENAAAASKLGTVERLVEELERCQSEPWMRNTLLEAFQRLLGMLDESAIPIVAHLMADAMSRHVSPGSFHRLLGELVCNLDQEDLEALAQLMALMNTEKCLQETKIFELRWNPRNCDHRYHLEVTHQDHDDTSLEHMPCDAYLEVPSGKSHRRLLHLLKRYEFGHDNPAGIRGRSSGPQVVVIDRLEVERLYRYVSKPLGAIEYTGPRCDGQFA